METASKPNLWFWAVGTFAVLWNGFGVFDMAMTLSGDEDYLAQYTPEQVDYWRSMPLWRNVIWVLGVGTAFAASILLLMRRALAAPLFAIGPLCLIAGLLDDLSGGAAHLYDVLGLSFSAVIITIGVLLTWYAYRLKARGVLGGPAPAAAIA